MEQRISLYFKDATSDKEYHLQLLEKDGKFVVNYQNGKRGGTLTDKTFTPQPVEYELAKKTYDKKVKEKLGQGYTPSETAQAFVSTSLEERFTGIVPQLLNEMPESDVDRLLTDPDWILEEKHDGHRRLLRHESTTANTGVTSFGINRKGLAVGMTEELAKAFEPLAALAPLTVDGELMGAQYVIYDVLEMHGQDLRALPLELRLEKRQELALAILMTNHKGPIGVTYTAKTESEKRTLWDWLKANKAEGGVFKRRDSAYVPGRPNLGGNQLKMPFWASATVIVDKVHKTKRSVSVYAFDDKGKKVKLGNVTIPVNYEMPQPEDLIEVRYRYAFIGGSLFTPVYRGKRDDIDREACTTAQLKYKREQDTENDDEEVVAQAA